MRADSERTLDPGLEGERLRLEDEVAHAEAELVEAEVGLETLRVELDNFAQEHHRRLGAYYHRLDELDAEIAEAVAVRTGTPDDMERARQARARVEDAPPDDEPDPDPAGRPRVRPSREAKRIYRDLARHAHPDLTQDPKEKQRRERFLRRANEAYARSDETRLSRLADEWAVRADKAPEQGAERVHWLGRRLDWLRSRLVDVRTTRERLEQSAIGQLLGIDPDDPDGLLDRLAVRLFTQIAQREDDLRAISG